MVYRGGLISVTGIHFKIWSRVKGGISDGASALVLEILQGGQGRRGMSGGRGGVR